MERKDVIERAYQLINEPIDPNLRCPVELVDLVEYKEAEAGETIQYFNTDRTIVDYILSINSDGDLVSTLVPMNGVVGLTPVGLQSNLETVLIDDVLNSKDSGALAARKDSIIRGMDKKEVKNVLDLCLGAGASQEVNKISGEDLLDVIIKMKQKISDYATNYILLVASDVMDAIEKYDKENANNFNYKMAIKEEIANLGITKIVKVIGLLSTTGLVGGNVPVLAAGKAILVGRDSSLAIGKPLTVVRRKFTKEVAELSGAGEGAVRLVEVIKTPQIVNVNGHNTLGYGVFGYEQIVEVLTNKRAVAFSDDIIA